MIRQFVRRLGPAIAGACVLIAAAPTSGAQQPTATAVEGTVRDAGSGVGLPNAQVFVVGTQTGTVSGATGTYRIGNAPAGTVEVRVRMIGYAQATKSVTVAPGQTARADFTLAQSAVQLDAVVTTGTGTAVETKKLGNTIATLNLADLQQAPIQTTTEALSARIPGVSVQPSTGVTGAGARIRIRGSASLSQSNNPIIYIDGVRADNGGSGSGAATSRLDDIDPNSIERMEVLKGAAAATLYGTEASNGVIQIFTKRGVPGETRITVSSEMGTSRLKTADDFGVDLPYRDQFLSQFRTPRVQEHHVGVSGGAGDITYSLGAAFAKDDGYIPKNGETRSSLTTSFRTSPTKQLSVQLSGSMVRRNFDLSTLYLGSNRTTVEQALRTITRTETEVDRLYGSLALSYQPNSIWQNRLTIGTDDNNEVNERLSQAAATGVTRDRVSREFRRTSGNFISTLAYPQTGRFTSTLSVGGEAFHDVTDRLRLRGQGLPNFDVTDFDLASTILGGDQGLPTDLSSKVAQVGGFLQEQIGIDDSVHDSSPDDRANHRKPWPGSDSR